MHSIAFLQGVLMFKPLVRNDLLQCDRTYLEKIKMTLFGFCVELFSFKELQDFFYWTTPFDLSLQLLFSFQNVEQI